MPTKQTPQYLSRKVTANRTLVNPFGGGYSVTDISQSGVDYVDSHTGVSLPKWRSVIKSGGSATTAASGTRLRRLENQEFSLTCGYRADPPGSYDSYSETVSGSLIETIQLPGHISGTSLTTADNQALSQAFNALSQQRNHTQGLVFLGELRETLAMVRRPYQGMCDLLSGYLKRVQSKTRLPGGAKRWKRKDLKKVLADTWLETTFGMVPLINDVKSIAETVARAKYDSRRTFIHGYGTDTKAESETHNNGGGLYTLVAVSSVTRTIQSQHYKVALDFSNKADFGSADRLIELSGFSPEDWIPSLYELIPWSFLVDYFSNLGNLVQAGCSNQQEVKWVNSTNRLETVKSLQFSPRCPFVGLDQRYWQSGAKVGSCVFSRVDFQRGSTAKLSLPTLEVSLPGRPIQWGNMVALLQSQERSIIKGFKF